MINRDGATNEDCHPADLRLELFEALFDSSEIGICVTDQDRRFVLVNPAYCRAYGYSRDELIGQPFTKVLPPEMRAHAGQLHDEFLADGSESAGESEVVDNAGQRRPVLVTAGRIVLADKRRYKVTTVTNVSETRRTEQELEQLSQVVARTSDGVILTDAAGKVTWANQSMLRLTGFSLDELRGRNPVELLQGPDSDPEVIAHMAQQMAAGEGFQVEICNYTKGGQQYDLHIVCSPVRDSAGKLEGYIELYTDISERKRIERRIERFKFEAHNLRVAIDQSPASIIITNCDGKIEFVNQTCLDNSGYAREELLGKTPRIFQSGSTDESVYADLWATISAGRSWQGRLVNRRKDGSEYVDWASISPVFGENNQPVRFIAVNEDVTERERLRERLNSMARFDALTGLANRSAFLEALEERLAHLKPNQTRQPLALVNIDRFHEFNALHGHEAADRMLQLVAQYLVANAPDRSLVARLGPDEFAVLPPLERIGDDRSKDQLELKWIQRIQRGSHTGWSIDGSIRQASASVGIAFCDVGDISDGPICPGDFMSMADSALHAAKSRGGAQVAFFDAETSVQAQEAMRLEQDLSQAIERGEMHLALQAQVRPDGGLVGAEALLRWRHCMLGDISPGRFIPLAEDSGEIVNIGQWVLAQALEVLASLQAFDPSLTVSVNISPIQIRRGAFVDEVKRLLEETRVEPSGLILEITESVFMADPELARKRLQALRDLGIGIAIDDFGTGYSSLTYLKRLPVSELKIDQTFVAGLPDDKADAALVNIILSAAYQLKLRVVAEGVETTAQAQHLGQRSRAVLQGYLYDRPSTIEDWMGKWVKATSRT